MPELVEQGATPIFDAEFTDVDGNPIDATGVLASIIDAAGTTVVNLDPPSAHPSLGHYQYAYTVPADGAPGAWAIRWFGVVNGDQVGPVEEGFTVVRAGAAASPGTGEGVTCSPWATHEDAPAALQVYSIDPDEVDEAFQVASDILFELTGRRYPGVCSDTIRPQAQWRALERNGWWDRSIFDRYPYAFCSCHRGRETGCSTVPEIKLPGHPVDPTSIVVRVNGSVLDPEDYRLDDHRFLIRIDGEGWPCCQNLLALDTEDRTFSIRYSWGRLPDIGGRKMAALLGTRLFADWNPELAAQCKPPKRATTITRAGVTIQLGDPIQMVEAGLTGIDAVDMWVASKAFGQARRRATVLVPGRHRSARRVGQ